MVVVNGQILAGQRLAEQLGMVLGREMNSAGGQTAATTLKDAIGRVLAGQWLRWDSSGDCDFLGQDTTPRALGLNAELTSKGPGAVDGLNNESSDQGSSAAITAIANEIDSQTADGTDDAWYDLADISA
jgi:hypothetical protein